MNYIETYIQKMHSMLQGSGSIKISSFVDDHILAKPILHPHVDSKKPDLSALIYTILRLPPEIFTCETLIMGQSDRVFEKNDIIITEPAWQPTQAIARSRKFSWHEKTKTLAVFISSISDLEDLVTCLTALSIEMTKLRTLTQQPKINLKHCFKQTDYEKLIEALGEQETAFAARVHEPHDYELSLLAGSLVDYSKAVQEWWINIAASRKEYPINVYTQPVYFVSSNSHSLINLLSGFPHKQKSFLVKDNAKRIKETHAEFEREGVPTENQCYYLSRFSEHRHASYVQQKLATEKKHGLFRMNPYAHIDIEAQIFSIKDFIKNRQMDPRIALSAAMKKRLLKSDALIINMAYPLGMAAYSILREVSENVPELRGVYIMGKAASLNCEVGDITIPNYVKDTHTNNHIFFTNHFTVDTFAPYFKKNSILSQQKEICVRGTFLQSEASLSNDFKDGYSIVEMESGPFLNRVFELLYPDRYPINSTFVLNPDFRLGLAYYVSDTPQKRGLNLGAKRLTWEGLNATYAISAGILNDILRTESERAGAV